MTNTTATQIQQPNSRFGLAQMMVVVAICAIALACAFPGNHIPGRPKPGINPWNLVLGLSELVVGLFSLLGGLLVVSHWIRDRKMPDEPGCLLFLYCAFAFLFSNAAEIIFASMLDKANSGDPLHQLSYGAGLLYVRCITGLFLSFICLFGFRHNRWWWQIGFFGLMFSMLANLGIAAIGFTVLISQNNNAASVAFVRQIVAVFTALAVLWLVVCALIDVMKKEQHSRIHWLGFFCFLVFSIVPTITLMIASRYLSFNDLYGVE